ncbi:MAG: hypothetical protein ABJK25_01030 [Halieaceae bacterium]
MIISICRPTAASFALLVTAFFAILFGNSTLAQNNACDADTVTFEEAVTNSCTVVKNLSIDGEATPDLTSLVGLEHLTNVTGALQLYRNRELKNLDGLQNLISVGELSVGDSPLLSSIEGLDALTSADRITLFDLPDLSSLAGLERVAATTLFIGRTAISSLNGLNGSSLGNVSLRDNSELLSISSLDAANLSIVTLSGNSALSSISPLEEATSISVLKIERSAIESIQLPGLVEFGQLVITDNPVLTKIDIPNAQQNTAAFNFCGGDTNTFSSIRDNPELNVINLKLFPIIDSDQCYANWFFTGAKLTSLTLGGVSDETSGRGFFSLFDTSLESFVSPANFRVVTIKDNSALKRLKLAEKGETLFRVSNNPSLVEIDGRGLETSGGFGIESNAKLKSIDLRDLQTFRDWNLSYQQGCPGRRVPSLGALGIKNNPMLTDIRSGLSATSYVEQACIYNNAALTNCGALGPWLGWSPDLDGPTLNTEKLNIFDNGAGANSAEECYDAYVPPTPSELVGDLVDEVTELNLAQGISNAYDAKLESALSALDDANEKNDGAAVNKLYAFIASVEAQRGGKLTDAQANKLIAAAMGVIETI